MAAEAFCLSLEGCRQDANPQQWLVYYGYIVRAIICKAIGIRDRQLTQLETQGRVICIDTPIAGTEDITIADTVADENLPPIDAGILADDLHQTLRAAVNSLNTRQSEVITRHYFEG